MPATLTLTLKNDPSEIGRLVDLLEAFGPQSGLTDDATFKLTLRWTKSSPTSSATGSTMIGNIGSR